MKILILALMMTSCWANVSPDSRFNMPFRSEVTTPQPDQTKKISDPNQRLSAMDYDIRGALRDVLNRFENRDGSISPRLRSMLDDPNASLGKIIAYMFERQQTSMQGEIDGMKSQLKQLQDTVDAMNGELASYAARFKPPKESQSAVKQRMRERFPVDTSH